MNHSPTEGAQGSLTPKNAKTLRLFAIVRAEHIQSAFTDIPALYETEQDARNDMMAPLESATYPMVLLPAENYDALSRQLAQSEERVAKLEGALRESSEALRRAIQHVPANAVNMEIALHSPIADARTLDHCERIMAQSAALLSSSKTN